MPPSVKSESCVTSFQLSCLQVSASNPSLTSFEPVSKSVVVVMESTATIVLARTPDLGLFNDVTSDVFVGTGSAEFHGSHGSSVVAGAFEGDVPVMSIHFLDPPCGFCIFRKVS